LRSPRLPRARSPGPPADLTPGVAAGWWRAWGRACPCSSTEQDLVRWEQVLQEAVIGPPYVEPEPEEPAPPEPEPEEEPQPTVLSGGSFELSEACRLGVAGGGGGGGGVPLPPPDYPPPAVFQYTFEEEERLLAAHEASKTLDAAAERRRVAEEALARGDEAGAPPPSPAHLLPSLAR
jgi:hypothetical protein